MRKQARLPLALLLVSFAVIPAACSSKPNPPPVTPTPTPTVDAGPEAGDGGAVWGAMGATSASTSTSGSAPSASASASTSPSALPMGLTLEALDAAIDLALKASSVKEAPGTAAEGPAGRATLGANEHFSMLVTLQPNRCYTIMGFSPPGQVADLELKLMAPPLFNVPAGQSGAADKSAPIIGKGKGALCPILPIPISYRIDATAKKGTGRIGIQLFARNK